jgi:hypothetical protein
VIQQFRFSWTIILAASRRFLRYLEVRILSGM